METRVRFLISDFHPVMESSETGGDGTKVSIDLRLSGFLERPFVVLMTCLIAAFRTNP